MFAALGALVGVLAAHRRGFSLVAGALGGAFLGPLSFLMFFVSSVDRGRTCPQCAERVKADARKCKHCGSELVPASVLKYGAAKSR